VINTKFFQVDLLLWFIQPEAFKDMVLHICSLLPGSLGHILKVVCLKVDYQSHLSKDFIDSCTSGL